MKFSIVINTFNRAIYLKDALLGLSELDYDDFEVIVVNGPSTDSTEAVLDDWRDVVKTARCGEANLSMSRNIGIEMAAGDVVAFIDDDAVPHPAWLTSLAGHYADPKVGGVGGFTVDNTGVTYQVRKTVCDRFGNAHSPTDFFDERQLSFSGTPFYPSLLGTNSSFRTSALKKIGGFDHTFAYLLDETDVCLRLVDAGYRIVYEANALVFHQFAPSHIRSKNRVAKTLYPSAVSKSYFIKRHGALLSETRATDELNRYEEEILRANKWLADHNEITLQHKASLDDDLLFGIRDGTRRAMQRLVSAQPDLGDLNMEAVAPSFTRMPTKPGLTIALISRSFPPLHEAGIARWTWMMANGLAGKGHKIHVVTLADGEAYSRYENGFWVHAIGEDEPEKAELLIAQKNVPSGIAPWCAAVQRKINSLKSFGLKVVSFPIWDVEGMALLGDSSIGLVMSLHTSYAMAKPFKREWSERPLFAHFHVDRVIAAEKLLLESIPHLLGNSDAIINDLEQAYDVSIRNRSLVAPHGTLDPLKSARRSVIDDQPSDPSILKVTYVGRFEPRKGFDIACKAFTSLIQTSASIQFSFIGDVLNANAVAVINEHSATSLLDNPRVVFRGFLSREELDAAYMQSDVVLMPSRYESFGLVAIEAMAAGAAVIALAAGGLCEVVEHKHNGFLVSPGENAASEIANFINQLSRDGAMLGNMKRNARESFEAKYTVDAMVAKAEAIYQSAARRAA